MFLTAMLCCGYEFHLHSASAFAAHLRGLTRMTQVRAASQNQGIELQKSFAIMRDRFIAFATFSCSALPITAVDHSWFLSSSLDTPWERLQLITWMLPGIRFRSRTTLSGDKLEPCATRKLLTDTSDLLSALRGWSINETSTDRESEFVKISDRYDASVSMMWRWAIACEIVCLE